ncbi:hypothetical protein GWK47_001567 [Chionoecetes opilio]|uniref:Uncharacterized protein n=1 Tax=Chionoecetes opilio TaxID=41210 RepID=A0A8J4XZ99_CHIOP|nr:hypothetical protein GWK47_001567 [Chionoecetes opilio]
MMSDCTSVSDSESVAVTDLEYDPQSDTERNDAGRVYYEENEPQIVMGSYMFEPEYEVDEQVLAEPEPSPPKSCANQNYRGVDGVVARLSKVSTGGLPITITIITIITTTITIIITIITFTTTTITITTITTTSHHTIATTPFIHMFPLLPPQIIHYPHFPPVPPPTLTAQGLMAVLLKSFARAGESVRQALSDSLLLNATSAPPGAAPPGLAKEKYWNSLANIMDALLEFEHFDLLDAAEAERIRLPRRIVKDRLDLFLSLTEEEFTSRFRLSKHSARTLLDDLNLPEAYDARG